MTLPVAASRLLDRLQLHGVRLGLETTRSLLAALGNPQGRYPVVLVGGTNGKGSTAAWLAAMAVAAGYRTGLYTSPHLEDVEERVRVDGHALPGRELGRRLLEVADVAARVLEDPPTYFEAVTVAAMLSFAAAEVELAVLEVGLGGRLDSTNATEPVLSLITEIGLDHQGHLGETLSEIAAEKAGILRGGQPAIAACSRPEALAAVRRTAAAVGAELRIAGEEAALERAGSAGGLVVETPGGRHHLRPSLAGSHQRCNLVLAVLAAEELARQGWSGLDRQAIAEGAARCRWPGRLESVATPSGASVLLDVAHNVDAAGCLAAHLRALGRPYDLLYGSLADKACELILPPLAGPAGQVVLTRPPSERALEPERLRPLLAQRDAIVEPRCGPALDRALAAGADLVVACGSVYLVGEVRRLLRRRFGAPPPPAATTAC